MANYYSKQFQLRTPSGVHLIVPAGQTINIETKRYHTEPTWTELETGLTAGEYFFTSYDILYLRLTSDIQINDVDLRIKWYDQRTHDYNFAGPELVAAVAID